MTCLTAFLNSGGIRSVSESIFAMKATAAHDAMPRAMALLELRISCSIDISSAKSLSLRVSRDNHTIAGRGRASSPAPKGPLSRFDRSQAGRRALPSRLARARSLRSQAIGAGLPLSSGADHSKFPTFARALADRAGDHLGTAGAARTSATLSPWAMGRPVPLRVRPRATKTGGSKAPAVHHFGSIVPCTRHHTPASAMMQRSARHSCAGVA